MKTKFVITHLIISCTFALQAADSYQAEIQLINSILLERKEFYEKFPALEYLAHCSLVYGSVHMILVY